MKVEKLGNNVVKVTVTLEEVFEKTGMTASDYSVGSPQIHEYARTIIYDPEIIKLFTNDGMFYAQVKLLPDNIEILLTIQPPEASGNLLDQNSHSFPTYSNEVGKPKKKRSKTDRQLDRIVIFFSNLEDCISACARVVTAGHRRLKNTRLFLTNGEYFITIDSYNYLGREYDMENMISILREFGDECLDTEPFLLEHGKLLVDADAIRVMANLA